MMLGGGEEGGRKRNNATMVTGGECNALVDWLNYYTLLPDA